MPSLLPLLWAVNPATALPSERASSWSNPRRSATTAAQRVRTGARLIWIMRSLMGALACLKSRRRWNQAEPVRIHGRKQVVMQNYFFCAALILAQRALCAAAILPRASAENLGLRLIPAFV